MHCVTFRALLAMLLSSAPLMRAQAQPAPSAQPSSNPSSNEDTNESADPSTSVEGQEVFSETIYIEAEEPYMPVASQTIRDRDLRLRPRPRPADILRAVPGIVVNQHAGGGKANQYFLRGFDADHGTDVALSFDGIPLNLVSHGHGQGYTDLNWIIPELVEHIDVAKGPYSVHHGDFATAGAVTMMTHDSMPTSVLSATIGRFGTYRMLGIASPELQGGWRSLLAGETYLTDGPFKHPEEYRRHSIYAKVAGELGRASIKLAATSYGGGWNGSGQIPLREVEAGRLERFGSIDATEGGNAARHSVYGIVDTRHNDAELHLLCYLVRSRLALYSNFTFFALDPERGDQIEQVDARTYMGGQGTYRFRRRLGTLRLDTTLGMEVRSDTIDNGLFQTFRRERLGMVVDAEVDETSLALLAQEDIRFTSWLRAIVGARTDFFTFAVRDRTEDIGTVGSAGSGVAERAIASPKGSVVVTPAPHTDVYVNVGFGFHSNDARAVVRRPAQGTPTARAIGYELGARTRLFSRLDLAGSLWQLDLDSEVVWVGDEGTTEARGATTRRGFEVEARASLLDWLFADLDVTVSSARFDDLPDGANAVPLAPRFTFTGGVSALHPNGIFGRFGMRALSDRPLTEDRMLVAEGFTLLDLTLGYRGRGYEIALSADNLLNTAWREAQFATSSRLSGDPMPGAVPPADACAPTARLDTDEQGGFVGCEDVHFTPGAPLNVLLTGRLLF